MTAVGSRLAVLWLLIGTGVLPQRSSMRKPFIKLDYTDTSVLKGVSILAIALHNYFHLLVPAKENEFDFDVARFSVFLQGIQDPRQIVQTLFSFWGHYGVQIFIFLSAYGLAVRYWDAQVRWVEFVWTRVTKIYPTFLLAIIAWALFVGLLNPTSPLGLVRLHAGPLVLTILGVQNVVPGYGLPPVGPWWFLPFIMQFYCLWPVLRRFAIRTEIAGLAVLSCASIALTHYCNDGLIARYSINLLETPVGHLPELCLGIAAARYAVFPGGLTALLATIVFVVSNFTRVLWPFSFVSALVVMLWLYRAGREHLRRLPALGYLGNGAMAIFFVNGFTRLPFLAVASVQKTWPAGLLLGFASVAFAVAVAALLSASELKVRAIAVERNKPLGMRSRTSDRKSIKI